MPSDCFKEAMMCLIFKKNALLYIVIKNNNQKVINAVTWTQVRIFLEPEQGNVVLMVVRVVAWMDLNLVHAVSLQ